MLAVVLGGVGFIVGAALAALGLADLAQRRHSILRNYPILGHMRFALEAIRSDYTNAARAMMMATGCIQSLRCQTNQCPVGVATQDPRRSRALDIPDKTERVRRYQPATVAEAQRIIHSMGLSSPAELGPHHLVRRIDFVRSQSYAELYEWLTPGALIGDDPPSGWREDLRRADPDDFAPRT